MASGPDQADDMPSTTISWLSNSMPAEALARPDHSDQLAPMSVSDSAARSISPSATAAPSPLAARDRPIDLRWARGATVTPRRPRPPRRAGLEVVAGGVASGVGRRGGGGWGSMRFDARAASMPPTSSGAEAEMR